VVLPPCDNSNLGIQENYGYFKIWPCGTQVEITGPASVKSSVQAAAAVWNGALYHLSLAGVPRLGWVNSSAAAVNVVVTSGANFGSPVWCGGVNGPPGIPTQVTMKTEGCGSTASPFGEVLIHEFAQVLGYSDGLEDIAPLNCVIRLQENHQVNTSPCQHELDFIYASYGYHSINGQTFWATPIVTGFAGLPASVTVSENDSLAVTATALRFARQPTGDQPLGGTMIGWHSDNGQVASPQSSSGGTTWIRGNQVGTTIIRARIGSGLSSGYQRGAVLTLAGQEIVVQVTPAPSGPFKATDIQGLTPPATEAGTYPLTAVVVNIPPGMLQVRWQVTYSNGVLGPIDTGYGPTTYSLQVPAGSYNIHVIATPRIVQGTSYTVGTHVIRDFPVCTGGGGGGGGDLVASAGGGGGTDAVGGC